MAEEIDVQELKRIVEALLFSARDPVSIDEIRKVVEGFSPAAIRETILNIQTEYSNDKRGICIVEIAGGFQMCTKSELSSYLGMFHKIQVRQKLSRPALETVAIVAYRQPIVRSQIEAIRGVDVGGVLKTLIEKGLVRITGKKKGPGNPFMYGTTDEFLRYFGLAGLSQLPEVKKNPTEGGDLKNELEPNEREDR